MVSIPCLAAVGIIMKMVAVLFALTCIALILIILMQKGKGGGLSSAFGGGMAGGVLGSKTGDFLTWVTISLVGVFLLLAVIMAKFYKPSVEDGDLTTQTSTQTLPDSNNAGSAGDMPLPDMPAIPDSNEG